jgi:L-amino acid N-acyltransferase YncA
MPVRPAAAQDLPAIQSIYAHHVLHGLASFEETPPDLAEMRRRFDDITGQGLPYLAVEEKGEILGYGYCSLYRTRSAYRYTLEDSVYVRQGLHRKGIGKAILQALIERCTALNYRQIIAVIGDSANAGSINLHASLGFVRAGNLRSTGFKFGRWVDSVLMQLPLGAGDGTKP